MKEQTQTMAADAFTIKSYQKNAKVGNCVWNWNLIFSHVGLGVGGCVVKTKVVVFFF